MYLLEVRKPKVDITISEILDYISVIMGSWWKNVNSSNNTFNKAKFKISPLFLKFNITSDLVPGFSNEGPNNCNSKCCVINTNTEEAIYFSKEEA
jgi:hypothetical protein